MAEKIREKIFAVMVKGRTKKKPLIQMIQKADPLAQIHPEGSPVGFWVKTRLKRQIIWEMMGYEGALISSCLTDVDFKPKS